MTHVLVIDDDLETRETFCAALRSGGYQVSSAETARSGTALAKQLQPTLAIVEFRLPDADGISVLRSLRQYSPATAVVVMTGCGTVQLAVEAMQLGAASFLLKPIDSIQLLTLTKRMVPGLKPVVHESSPATFHALDRWADLVTRTIDLPSDPHTVALWARGTATSAGAIRTWCRAAHLPVKASLNFARMMRVVAGQFDGPKAIGDLLNIIDTRTLVRFLRFGSPTAPPATLPLTIDEFLERQHWIMDRAALDRLRQSWATRFKTAPPDEASSGEANTIVDRAAITR